MSDLHEKADDQTEIRHLRLKLAESRKAGEALQQMVDALASLPALNHFVPAALRIVAQAFETSDCAYYEHRIGHPIRLRYWFLDGMVFGPECIQAFGDDHPHVGIKVLEKGFVMPDTYLGVSFRQRTKAQVVSHEGDQPGDEWYDLRRQLDWYTTLNVPLVINGEADGALIINRGRDAAYTSWEIELAERLAQQLALAMAVDQLTTDAREAASAQASQLEAQTQLDEMAKTDRALQQTTDALAAMRDLDNFIPAVLQIIATAFNLKDCAYYEHQLGEPIRLRYWFFGNQVLSPDQIAVLDGENAFMRQLSVEGFTVPDSYIGVPFRNRTWATVVDHTKAESPSVFDDECNRRGWHLELNVPMVVAGEADGALLIYRGIDAPFTPREISLAERLCQQLALAIEANRLSGVAKDVAVAKERERAERERVIELSRYAEVLKQTIDSLVEEKDFLGFIGRLLLIASVQIQAPITEYWVNDKTERATLLLTCRDGVLFDGSDEPDDIRAKGIPISPHIVGLDLYGNQKQHQIIDMLENIEVRAHVEDIGVPVASWCSARGVRQVVIIPLMHGEFNQGSLCLYLPANRILEQPQLDLALSLGQQVSLAARMTELAEESKQSALLREREQATNIRAEELAKANVLLRSSLDQLSDERDLESFPRSILRIAMEQSGAQDAVIFVLDKITDTLRLEEYLGSLNAPLAPQAEFSGPFPVNSAPFWAHAMGAKSPVVYDMDKEGHMMLPGAAAWHRTRGNRSVAIAPMFISTEPYGIFGMGLPQPAEMVSKVDLELMQALAQQASLAIQLMRLADKSKQGALLGEREAAANNRAAELTKANALLRATLEKLSDERDLQSFPRAILRIAMEQSEARDGAIFVFDRKTNTLQSTEYLGSLSSPKASRVEFSKPFPVAAEPVWVNAMAARRALVYDTETEGHKLLPGAAEWHRNRGNQSVMIVPMFINLEPYGYFGMGLPKRAEDVSRVELELMQALTQQASLAIQLARLADELQQAALAQEREKAADERAAEFANANEVLRSMLGRLSIEHELHAFSRTILQEAMKQTTARDGLILLFDEYTDTLNISDYISSDGLPPSVEFSNPFSASGTPAWCAMIGKRAPVVFDVDQDGAMLLPGLAQWHLQRGNRSIVATAMFIGSRPYGYFGIALGERATDVSNVKVGLIHSLAQQATLAIQLASLADKSKQTAVAQEREKAADVRAAEFANANAVLTSTFDQLSKQQDLRSLPRTILMEAMKHTGAKDGLIMLFDKIRDSLSPLDYINVDGLLPHEAFTQPCLARSSLSWSVLLDRRAPVVFTTEEAGPMLPQPLVEWHRLRGNRSILATLMVIDSQPYGYFGITLEEGASEVSNVKIDLIQSLAQQATLAIQLTSLAEASQQAAIMVERQQVVVQERANMAREIHDRLAQGYAAILMQQHTMRRSLLREEGLAAAAQLLEQLDIIERLSRENLAEARKTMDELRVDPFGPGNLAAALGHCIGQLSRERDFSVSLDLDEDLPLLRRYVETELCRIVVEAVTNARKHARSGSARVCVIKGGDEVRISIQDDGVGFDMQGIGSSFGIASMQERAARAGAAITIVSAPGCGTNVQVILTP